MIENARVGATMLGLEDRGVFTFGITLTGDHWSQTYGNWSLQVTGRDPRGDAIGAPWAGPMILGLLNTLKVDSWERLRGQLVRVKRDRPLGPILCVGHAVEDRWFRCEDYELFFDEDRPLWPTPPAGVETKS